MGEEKFLVDEEEERIGALVGVASDHGRVEIGEVTERVPPIHRSGTGDALSEGEATGEDDDGGMVVVSGSGRSILGKLDWPATTEGRSNSDRRIDANLTSGELGSVEGESEAESTATLAASGACIAELEWLEDLFGPRVSERPSEQD